MATKADGRIRVNGDISDLFFNTEHDSAAEFNRNGEFDGYNQDRLCEIANDFLASLQRLGVQVPPVADLVADFYNRL